MKITTVIERADALRPNTLDSVQKAAWVEALDGQIADMIGVRPQHIDWPVEDPDLLIPAPYDEVYQLYLICRIDYYNAEMDMYANDSAVYEAALDEALSWYRRHHYPRQRGGFIVL